MRTKSILFTLITVLIITTLVFQSCKKDDEPIEDPIEYTEDGLQVGEPPMPEDLIIVDTTTMSIQVDQEIIPNDFETDYLLELEGFEAEELKPGMVIVDFSGDGRIWVVKEVSSNKSIKTIIANIGTLATMLTNVVMEISTAGNRAKIQSDNPNKLGWAKFKMISGNGDPVVEFNLDNINIGEIYNQDGVVISVNANTVELNFTDFELYSNSSGTFNVTIPNGLIEVNNAVDFKVRFNPIAGFYLGIPMTLGNIKEFKSSIYSVVDSDITLNIQATTNGTVDLVNYEKEIGSYNKVVAVPPYFFLTVQVDLTAKLTIDTEAEFNLTPHYVTKNNFEMRMDYNGLLADNDLSVHFENIENELTTNITGDFYLGQRLEIVPEVTILAYGLIGPSGQIIPYEKLDLNAELINDLVNWDVGLDVGLDYYASLDVSLLNYEDLTESLISQEGNLFNFELYNAPFQAEIIGGNNQTAEAGTELSEPISITVKDNFNNTIPLVAVHFEIEANNGTFENAYVYTNFEGIAENNWTLGNTAGTQSVNILVKDGQGNVITGTELFISATATGGSTNTPTVTTTEITNITQTTASGGGNVTDDGGLDVTARGICWNTSPSPTIANNITNDGTGTGIFTSSLTGLNASTLYYVRAYATNSEGTAYGNQVQFTAQSGNNNPPTASFTVDPSSGTTSINFAFDASGSTDPEDLTSDLQVRWDFDGDGSWDTDWNTNKTENHQYSNEDTYTAKLEVKDTEGLLDQCTQNITVTNGDYGEVYNPATGKTWLDRNLGASQVATSSTDEAAYGDLYQWGRAADGHQSRTSNTTTTLSSSDIPGHGNFITSSSDWRSPQNDNLWQGANGTNNPCPSGYRLPSDEEWQAERESWSSNNAAGAFASPLKLPAAGTRYGNNGSIGGSDHDGFYWASTRHGVTSERLHYNSSGGDEGSSYRANGNSVRCIKE